MRDWDKFLSRRTELLKTLAPPVMHGFQQCDTVDADSPMFNGSWDWHSAVHAAYSLHVFVRETRDSMYMKVIDTKIKPERLGELVQQELEYMRSEAVQNREIPYGFAWMLLLVRERERLTRTLDMRPLACESVSGIRQWMDNLTADEARAMVLADSYRNLSWALINLQLWAVHTEDAELKAYVQKRMMATLKDEELDALWPVEVDTQLTQLQFFPPALMRLAAVSQIWDAPEHEVRQWITQRLPKELCIEPITEPLTGHATGLNFSRAYCLWHIFKIVNDLKLRDNFVDLIDYQVSRPDLWNGEYYNSHWVAQFGVRAIDETFAGPTG
jgi:hypothetical protein